MDSLQIENLSRVTGMVGDSAASGNVASEGMAIREMKENGLPQQSQDSTRTFSQIMRDSVEQVNQYQSQADTAVKELLAGRTKNIHETLLTIERADASLKLAMQVRNKILDAYREIMRMQV